MSLAGLLGLLMVSAAGLALAVGVPAGIALAGTGALFALLGTALGLASPSLLASFPDLTLRSVTGETLAAVPLLVFMGVMLERAGVLDDVVRTAGVLADRGRAGGGLGAFLAGVVGAALAGMVAPLAAMLAAGFLPAMVRAGHSPRFAAGTLAAAGSFGPLIAPSVALLVLGDQLADAFQRAELGAQRLSADSVPVSALFAGALIPALLLVVLHVGLQLGAAWSREAVRRRLDETSLPLRGAGAALAPSLILVAIVLGAVLSGRATVLEGAAIGAAGAVVVAALRAAPGDVAPAVAAGGFALSLVLARLVDLRLQRETIPAAGWLGVALAALALGGLAYGVVAAAAKVARAGWLGPALDASVRIAAMIFLVAIGAALFGATFRALGGDGHVLAVMAAVPGGAAGAVLATLLLILLLALVLDFLQIAFVVLPLVAPALFLTAWADGRELDPVWLGVMAAMLLRIAAMAPPFGLSLDQIAGAAPGLPLREIRRGVLPFLVAEAAVVALVGLFPDLVVALPALLGLR